MVNQPKINETSKESNKETWRNRPIQKQSKDEEKAEKKSRRSSEAKSYCKVFSFKRVRFNSVDSQMRITMLKVFNPVFKIPPKRIIDSNSIYVYTK